MSNPTKKDIQDLRHAIQFNKWYDLQDQFVAKYGFDAFQAVYSTVNVFNGK